jgi:hypothetical protein
LHRLGLLVLQIHGLLCGDLVLEIGDLLLVFGDLNAEGEQRLVVWAAASGAAGLGHGVLLLALLQSLDLLQQLVQEKQSLRGERLI